MIEILVGIVQTIRQMYAGIAKHGSVQLRR